MNLLKNKWVLLLIAAAAIFVVAWALGFLIPLGLPGLI